MFVFILLSLFLLLLLPLLLHTHPSLILTISRLNLHPLFRCALQSMRIIRLRRRLGPDLHLRLIKPQTNCSALTLSTNKSALLFAALYPGEHHLHLSRGQLLLILGSADAQGGVEPFLVPPHGLIALQFELVPLQVFPLQVPVLLPPLAALVQDAELGRVAQVHLAVAVGHVPYLLPLEQRPPSTVSPADGHPNLPILLLLQVGYHHGMYGYLQEGVDGCGQAERVRNVEGANDSSWIW